ncbi:hypothetical protein [Parachitinimonas caeni]|uniref:Uncharacterized protein n=1 Tax=Parachitinimonas caeni TaxID=3031301 RepID=A0ABT7E224_9NEIS|nr:hypothetical protein [Parachitinimonas caeni]MDK2125393.1 hypothetical protein [Parachitinimonas caeni]
MTYPPKKLNRPAAKKQQIADLKQFINLNTANHRLHLPLQEMVVFNTSESRQSNAYWAGE